MEERRGRGVRKMKKKIDAEKLKKKRQKLWKVQRAALPKEPLQKVVQKKRT